MARRNPYRPGTLSYESQRRVDLNRIRALAEANAARAKRPEARRRAKRQASTARRGIRVIEGRSEYRERLSEDDRSRFNRFTLSEQDELRRYLQQYPDGIPPDVPGVFAGRNRGALWRMYYSSGARAGTPLRGAGLQRPAAE